MNRALHRAMFATCMAVTACAPARGPAQSGTPTPRPAEGAPAEHVHEQPAPAVPGVNAGDVKFMQNMIGHHAQAIVMAALVKTHGASSNVQRLAQKIDISQRDEIWMMKAWLTERKQSIPDDAHALHMMMPGMLTEEQMKKLDAARGREFERLFLTFMIQHHEGALLMVEELFKTPGAGQDSDIFRFATDVDADQRDEIFVMEKLLDLIETTSGSPSK